MSYYKETPFKPTHQIRHNRRTILVMAMDEDNGHWRPMFTREEWEKYESADWVLDDERGLLFQGKEPPGTVEYERVR